jgi:hypothetical protein
MLNLFMRRAVLDVEIEQLPDFVASLGDAYRPVLTTARIAQADALGLDFNRLSPREISDGLGQTTRFSELFGVQGGLIGIHLAYDERRAYFVGDDEEPVARNEWELMVYGIGSTEVKDPLDDLVALLQERLDIEAEPYRYVSNRFKELKAEGMTPPRAPSADEVSAARLLSDAVVRHVAISIASSGGLLVGDLPKQLPTQERGRAQAIADDLQGAGLVSSDLVVICSKTAEQVLRVPTKEALDQAAAAGLKCACGAGVLDEQAEQAISLTPLGRQLLDGSWWMSVLLIDELARLGIDHESMLVEQTDGGDEMDCFADVSGELVIFELKDKEFSLGNAYSFGSKFGIYRTAYSVVVTTAHVGNDAKEHFDKALSAQRDDRYPGSRNRSTTIQYIEGLDSLRSGLEELVGGVFQGDAEVLLRSNLLTAAFDVASVIEALSDTTADEVSGAQSHPGDTSDQMAASSRSD